MNRPPTTSMTINWHQWGVPTHLDAKEIGKAMAGVPGVKGTHDLHIRTMTSGLDALSAHVVVTVGEDGDAVLGRLQSLL